MRSSSFGPYRALILVIVFAFAAVNYGYSQTGADSSDYKEWNIRPRIGIGVGMLNYQGDLVGPRGYFNPFQNKGALHFNAAQPVNDFLDLNFYLMFGSLGADERTLVRNLNFKSRVTAGGLNLSYNFDHLLKENRVLEPYISIGFEAFDFKSRTDLIDGYGNRYHYWSDGTIRNLEETKENLSEAKEITRDYVYETDVRKLNADGFGDYSERSFAIPVGAGFNFLVNTKISMRMGMEYHWTFTDYIDGITPESRGIRAGNKPTDKFLHTYVRLSYDLTPTPHEEAPDFSGSDNSDSDQDSIADFLDDCPFTPLGIQVDSKGCPLDSDGDGFADYEDAEVNSPPGSVVDTVGVAMTDADFERMYLEFLDESGKYAQYTNESYSIETAERKTKRRGTEFAVKVGEFEGGISDSLANQLLSMPDVSTRTEGDKTVVEVNNISSIEGAVEKKVDLESKGIPTSGVTKTSASGKTSTVSNIEQDMAAKQKYGMTVPEAIAKNKALPPPKKLITSKTEYTLDRPIDARSVTKANDETYGGQTVYRVQVGAYANKLSNDIFKNEKDLLVITTEDGLTRYYVGAYTSYEQAAARKIDMVARGYGGAYVVPFRDGQKVSLQSTGVVPAENVVPLPSGSSQNYGKVKFMVQIGAYAGQIPTDVLDRMMELGRISQEDGADGKIRYFAGEFNSYEEAKAYTAELIAQGFGDSFVAAKFNGKVITANEGLELLK